MLLAEGIDILGVAVIVPAEGNFHLDHYPGRTFNVNWILVEHFSLLVQ